MLDLLLSPTKQYFIISQHVWNVKIKENGFSFFPKGPIVTLLTYNFLRNIFLCQFQCFFDPNCTEILYLITSLLQGPNLGLTRTQLGLFLVWQVLNPSGMVNLLPLNTMATPILIDDQNIATRRGILVYLIHFVRGSSHPWLPQSFCFFFPPKIVSLWDCCSSVD